jgi:hypothetical protein
VRGVELDVDDVDVDEDAKVVDVGAEADLCGNAGTEEETRVEDVGTAGMVNGEATVEG